MTKTYLQNNFKTNSSLDDELVQNILRRKFNLPALTEIPQEFFHVLKIVGNGTVKYEVNGWLKPDGQRSSHRQMHDSMFHHLAESFSGHRKDIDSGLDPLLHLACRALMLYTRKQRKIVHSDDVPYIQSLDE